MLQMILSAAIKLYLLPHVFTPPMISQHSPYNVLFLFVCGATAQNGPRPPHCGGI